MGFLGVLVWVKRVGKKGCFYGEKRVEMGVLWVNGWVNRGVSSTGGTGEVKCFGEGFTLGVPRQ
jgi:hypothetical protein